MASFLKFTAASGGSGAAADQPRDDDDEGAYLLANSDRW